MTSSPSSSSRTSGDVWLISFVSDFAACSFTVNRRKWMRRCVKCWPLQTLDWGYLDNLCRVGNVQHVRDRQVSLVSPEGIGLMR